LARGESFDDLIEDFSIITRDDILACIALGADAVDKAAPHLVSGASA
jgi:uncharacterized protein (DUF433 family)